MRAAFTVAHIGASSPPARSDLPGRDGAVGVGPAVAIEVPRVPHLADHGEVELGGDQLVLPVATLRQDLARAG